MDTFGYGFLFVGVIVLRQVMVGRAKETPQDVSDLAVAVLNADTTAIAEVMTRRGENTDPGVNGAVAAPGSVSASKIGEAAISKASSIAESGQTGWHNRCLALVQTAYKAAGVSQASQGTAANAASNAKYMHKLNRSGLRSVPAGVPVWWGGGQGHTVLSTGGGGCIGTDYPKDDVANISTLVAVDKWLGSSHPLIGWSEDCCGSRVYGGKTDG